MGKRSVNIPGCWDETADIIIIGSGFAGLAAAAEAKKLGAAVLILEKMPYFGGNSVIAGGGYASWDSSLKLREKLGLGGDSWELHMEDTLRGGGHLNDPALVEILVKGAPGGLDWLLEAGVVFRETLNRIGGHSAYRSYQAGCNIAEVMKKYALSLGAELRLNAAVTALCRDGADGPVTGVLVTENGAAKAISARLGVVVASGGFGSDVKMRAAYQPSAGEACNCTTHKGATGEMIARAQDIGADVVDMEHIQFFPCAEPKSGRIDKFALDCYSGPGYGLIYVNKQGKRFVSELAGRDVVSDAQIGGCEKPTYSILNGAVFGRLGRTEEGLRQAEEAGRVIRAGTLSGLADALGIPAEALNDTVTRHNAAVKNGSDPEFGEPITSQMAPLIAGPFYAVAQWPSVHYTMGGLRIDTETRVLDTKGRAIPRLYAAGEVCGGVHGKNRLGGNAIAECVVFGRIAGRNAKNKI
jgi:urocanate reductase